MFHVKHVLKKIRSVPIQELLFYIFIFCIPFQLRSILNSNEAYIDYYFSYHKAIFIYLADLVFLAFVVSCLLFKSKAIPFSIIVLPMILGLLSLFHVEQLTLALYGLYRIAQGFIILGFLALNRHIVSGTIAILIFSGFLQAILGILQFHVEQIRSLGVLGAYVPPIYDPGAATLDIEGQKLLRSYSTFPHPNVFGGFMAVALALWFYVSRETKLSLTNTGKLLAGTLILSWGLLVSYSRTAWIAAALSSAIIITYQLLKKAHKQAVISLLIIVVSGGILSLFYYDIFIHRSRDLVDKSSPAIQYRSMFNSWSEPVISNNFWFGVGPAQYIPTLEKSVSVDPWAYQPPHNIFLYILAEIGIIGCLVWGFVLSRFGFTWNIQNLTICGTILILGLLDHYLITIVPGQLLLFTMLGLVFAKKQKKFHVEHN